MILCVTEAGHATILAALRYYQEQGLGDPANRSDEIHEIATNAGLVLASLDDQGIDALCDRLNTEDDDAEALRAKARELYQDSECNIDIDDAAAISRNDIGAWVSAWVFVHDEDMGAQPQPIIQKGKS
jgi:hypothetical protein